MSTSAGRELSPAIESALAVLPHHSPGALPAGAVFLGVAADGRSSSDGLHAGEPQRWIVVWMGMRQRHPSTWSFFLLTFGITWTLQIPAVLAQRGVLAGSADAYMALAGLGIFGPLVAASVLTAREGGRAAVRALFARLCLWRTRPRYYVIALVLPCSLLTGLLVLLNLAGRHGPISYVPSIGGLVLGLVISVAEEVGWRGYAQPRLERSWGPLGASGILGVAWCVWHVPMFVGQGIPMNLMLVMLLMLIGASLLFSWILHVTGGSLLLVSLAHLAAHLNNSHRALPDETLPVVAHAIVYGALGLFAALQFVPTSAGGRVRSGISRGSPSKRG